MAICTAREPAQKHSVGMGQIVVAEAPAELVSVLGSCVGVALYHPRLKVGALAHIVLPKSSGGGAAPGKFADTAIPYMIAELAKAGAARAGLVAKIAGGACMFGVSGPLQIGESNIQAVESLLTAERFRIEARDVGGEKGRRVTLDCSTGDLIVEIAGKSRTVL